MESKNFTINYNNQDNTENPKEVQTLCKKKTTKMAEYKQIIQ